MAAQIRTELNILDHALVGALTSNEFVQLDTTQYNGTVTYYFEIVAAISSGSAAVTLRDKGDSSDDASITVTGATQTLYRSTAFTPTAGQTNYAVVSAANITVKSARIIVIQNATTLTNTETQIEIGNYNLDRTTESAIALVNPKYWLYTAANWDGTKTFYAEAVYNSGDMDTITVGIYESSSITAPSWSLNATIVSAATTTVPTRTRVAFTPVDGRWYTIFSLNGSMDNHDVYNAKVIVDQEPTSTNTYYFDGSDAAATDPGVVWTNDGNAFDSDDPTTPTTAATTSTSGNNSSNYLMAEGTNAPSSGGNIVNVYARLYSSSNGVRRANYEIFTDGLAESLGTGAADQVAAEWSDYVLLSTPSGGWTWAKVQALETKIWEGVGTASTISVFRIEVRVIDDTTPITKLEPQYLLANTLFAAGTALQTFLTDWDSTEWTGVTNAYYFQAEAANGSTSDVELWEADGGGAGLGVLTNIDNAQISSAVTMPADQNMDTKATTNAGDVAAARIFVAVSVDAAVEAGDTTKSFPYTRRTSPAAYTPGPAQYFERLKNVLRRLLPN